eukprot:gene27576-25258_t
MEDTHVTPVGFLLGEIGATDQLFLLRNVWSGQFIQVSSDSSAQERSAFSFAAAAAAATTECVNIHSHATRRTISIGGVVQIKRVDAHPRVGTTPPATSASGNDGSVSQVRQRRYTFQSVTNPGTCLRVVFRKQKQYEHRAQHLDKPFNLKDLKVCWSAIQGVGAVFELVPIDSSTGAVL